MATQEYLLRYIEANRKYADLPGRLKLAISEDEWARRVKSFCIHRGFSWAASPANEVCPEHEYYESLLVFYRTHKRIFPYHLAEYICRVLRVTPFKYYRDVLADAMREDLPYDSIPNFTAADAVRVVGVGRNEYIATMVQAKSKKLLWRVNKGIVKDLLPQDPKPLDPEPWWTVNLVNLSEVEHRSLTRAELDICQAAARRGGARYETLSSGLVNYLYRRGLVWFDVPVFSDDHLSIPPLEGFVSNKSAPTGSEEVDPLETLMYQLFVAASDRVTVGKLASILNVSVDTLRVGISVACRLKFCIKLLAGSNPSSATSIPSLSPQVPSFIPKEDSVDSTRDALSSLDLDMVLGAGTDTPKDKSSPVGPALGLIEGAQSGGVALVVDSEVTGFLMMGALTPAVKKHSVTLFEGGRVYGSQVINELVEELRASVAMAAGFEGEMAALANTAAALAVVLDCVRDGAGGRPIELLRKESVANLAPDAAFRILSHSYNVVLPVAGLPNPPLPLSIARAGPTNYGPIPVATTPWMHLALYAAMGQAPKSLVIPAGTRLARVPVQLQGSPAALIWPWNVAAVRASTAEPLVVSASALLFIMNSLLSKTALLVQPIDVNEADYQHSVISLPLPLQLVPSNKGSTKPGTPTAAALPPSSSSASGAWATFEEGTGPNKSNRSTPRSPSGDNNNNSAAGARYVVGYMKDGVVEEVALPTEWSEALQKLGLGGAVGTLRLLRVLRGGISEWVPLCVLLGVPLQPLELCNAVCSSAAAAGFLESGACKRHEEGQHALSSALDAVTRQHGLQGPEANSVDVDLLAEVPLPLQMLQIDTRGKINRGDLGGAQQGVSLLHHR